MSAHREKEKQQEKKIKKTNYTTMSINLKHLENV